MKKPKRIAGFGNLMDEAFDDEKQPESNGNILDLIHTATDDELLLIQDIIKERLESDARLTKIPDLLLPEFAVFDNRKVDKVTDKVLDIRRRRYIAFVFYYSHPERTDDQMVHFIRMGNPDLSYIEAVRDLSNIKLVIGNLPRARKELIRIQEIEMHKRAYQKALEKDNELVMTAAARNMGKAAGTDKEDLDIPWEQMMTPQFEPTDDISVTGRERIPEKDLDAKMKKLKARYDPDIQDAEETV